jgi:ataxin-3
MNQPNKQNIPNFPRKIVYFEKQSDDRLCGLHCLNNLLQGPYLDVITLSEIGIELDKIEQELTGVHSQNNVDNDGNFGVQVLEKALSMYGVTLKLLKKRQAINYIEQGVNNVEALIFNSSTHWYSIRRINGIWFDLNSTNTSPGPEIISDFYLSAFIQGAEDIGYTNFLVKNLPKLPEINDPIYKNLQPHQHLATIEQIIEAKEIKIAKKKQREEEQKKKEEEEAKKFKPFSGQGYMVDSNQNYNQHILDNFEDEDDEVKRIMKLSLEEYARNAAKSLPPEPEKGGYSIMINYNGKYYKRNFNGTDKIKHIVAFMKSQIPTNQPLLLFESYPKKNYDNEEITIQDSGLARNQVLLCRILN